MVLYIELHLLSGITDNTFDVLLLQWFTSTERCVLFSIVIQAIYKTCIDTTSEQQGHSISNTTTTTAPLLLASNLSVLWVVNSSMCDSILLQMANNAVVVSGWALDHSVFSKSWVVDGIELNSVSSLGVVGMDTRNCRAQLGAVEF